ncbi:MAG: GNAT family N-acetyltransferase [Acidobacteria bacterium]|nr:GNAT family N-acetyltransferase [Acidobacteriota bacterium]
MLSYKVDDETELRLIEPRHAERLDALIERNREHIREWSPWFKDDRSVENTRSFIRRNLSKLAADEGFALAIWHRGEMAGQIEYNYFDWANRRTELGYWLGASFQGRGLATNSCRALIDYAFAELKLNRVEMRCGVENVRSRRIPERLGFKEEGVVRQAEWLHGRFVDMVIYGMLASEWPANHRS